MSTTWLLSLLASAVSIVALLPLASRDPKRLRVLARLRNLSFSPLSIGLRRAGILATLLPGGLLLGFGKWSALLIWLAALSLAGWGIAQLFAPRSPKA